MNSRRHLASYDKDIERKHYRHILYSFSIQELVVSEKWMTFECCSCGLVHVDWSFDGRFLQTDSSSHRHQYWDAIEVCEIPDANESVTRVSWATWTCTQGWAVQVWLRGWGLVDQFNTDELVLKWKSEKLFFCGIGLRVNALCLEIFRSWSESVQQPNIYSMRWRKVMPFLSGINS